MSSAFLMGFFIRGEDKEVVHINDEPSFGDHVLERVVHESLKCGRRVGKSKEHHRWFEEALVRDEGGLPLVAIFDANIVVSPANIKLGEQFGVFELVDEVGDEGEWVGVLGGMFVQVAVILTRAEAAIFLLDKEEQGCLGGIRGADFSAIEVFLEEILSGFPGGNPQWLSWRKSSVAFCSSGDKGLHDVAHSSVWQSRCRLRLGTSGGGRERKKMERPCTRCEDVCDWVKPAGFLAQGWALACKGKGEL